MSPSGGDPGGDVAVSRSVDVVVSQVLPFFEIDSFNITYNVGVICSYSAHFTDLKLFLALRDVLHW